MADYDRELIVNILIDYRAELCGKAGSYTVTAVNECIDALREADVRESRAQTVSNPNSAAPDGDVEQRARELLADEWRENGYSEAAKWIISASLDGEEHALDRCVIRAITTALSAPKRVGVVPDFPHDATDLELVQQFVHTCRSMKPVGQWSGERLCVAIERLINGPRAFISETDMPQYREESGRVGFTRQNISPQAAPVPVDTKPDPTKCYHKFPMDPRRCVLCGWDFRNGEPVPVEGTTRSGWIEAADRELINAHLGVANPGDTLEVATKKLGELIDFHVSVATDPAVNGGFKLVPVEGDSQPVAEVIEVASYPDSFNTVRWLKPVSVGTKLYATPPPSQPAADWSDALEKATDRIVASGAERPAVELEQFRPAVTRALMFANSKYQHDHFTSLLALIDGAKGGEL